MSSPWRLRATYNRTGGVMHMLTTLDLATGKMFYRIQPCRRHRESWGYSKRYARAGPVRSLYMVCDNFCPHRHPTVTTWAVDNQVELVFLSTYGSWLSWIEAEFAALRYFALNGTDHRTQDEQNAAIDATFAGATPRQAQDRIRH